MMHQPISALYPAASLLLGIALGALWDLIGILNLPSDGTGRGMLARLDRMRRCAGRWMGDLIFCILSALSLSLLTYALNRGKLRFLALFALFCGFSLWYFSLSRFIRRASLTVKRYLMRKMAIAYAKTIGRLLRRIQSRIHLCARRAYTRRTQANLLRQIKQGSFAPPNHRTKSMK